jgi:hypothetical protein
VYSGCTDPEVVEGPYPAEVSPTTAIQACLQASSGQPLRTKVDTDWLLAEAAARIRSVSSGVSRTDTIAAERLLGFVRS